MLHHCCRFPHNKGWTAVDPKRSLVGADRDGKECPYLPFAIAVRIASVGRFAVYQRSGFEYSSGYEKRSFEGMGSSPPHSITSSAAAIEVG